MVSRKKESRMDNKSKTIATIDVNLQITGLEPRDWIQETVEEHLNCMLCGTTLEFKHTVNHIEQHVHEEAHCPGCNIRNRTQAHTLQ